MDMPSTPRSLLANALADEPAHLARSEPNPSHSKENRPPARAWRVRVRSDDYPGTLARFAIRLADLECRIVGLTRHPVPGGVLDEFVLRPATGLPQHLLIDALRDEGGDCLGMTETAIPELRAPAPAPEDSIAEAVARELLTPITDTPAPGRTTAAAPDTGEHGVPEATAFRADREMRAGMPACEHHASSASAADQTTRSEADASERSAAKPLPGAEHPPADSVVGESRGLGASAFAADREATSGTGVRKPAAAQPLALGKSDGDAAIRESPASAVNGFVAVQEAATGAGTTELRAATALPVAGELCIGTGDLPAPAAPARALAREAAVETSVCGLRDSTATALSAARRAIADPGCRAPMLRSVLSADLVTLVPANESNPARTEGGHRAVFPFGDGQAFVARRRWVAFADSELAQAAAFLELLAAAEQNLAGPMVLDRPDGAAVVLRIGTPRDIDAIGAVHLRCSAKTLFNRYHTGLRTVPRKWLHRLLMPPRGTSLLAVCGPDVIGFGQLISQRDGTAEVSLLVEDAWQRQGIGTALLARLIALAGADGITELTAVRLPSNDAMARTAARAGLYVETSPDDDTVLRLFAARTPRAPRPVSGSRTSLCPAPRAAPASSGRE
ncbi:GNAT family N-acetyltransferase [Amycolatopsis halotolerans]